MRAILLLTLLLALTACGQSGDLYLPDEAPQLTPAPQPAAAVTPPITDEAPAAREQTEEDRR